jgi:hypothetical protein
VPLCPRERRVCREGEREERRRHCGIAEDFRNRMRCGSQSPLARASDAPSCTRERRDGPEEVHGGNFRRKKVDRCRVMRPPNPPSRRRSCSPRAGRPACSRHMQC